VFGFRYNTKLRLAITGAAGDAVGANNGRDGESVEEKQCCRDCK
jgi:hypothetical protein